MTTSLPLSSFAALYQSMLLGAQRARGACFQQPEDDAAVLSRAWSGFNPEEALPAVDALCAFLGLDSGILLPGERHVADTLSRIRDEWESSGQRITFHTSGSTGIPKPFTHDFKELLEECKDLTRYFPQTSSFLSVVPCHHLYGFTFGLLLPHVMGLPVRRTLALPTVLAAESVAGDAVIGIPALWKAVNASRFNGSGKTAVSATAPVSAEVLAALESAGFAIADIYGSTETSVAGIRTSSKDSYSLMPRYSRTDGMALLKQQGGLLREVGLSDYLQWIDDRHFLPAGRIDHAVQVGGINVYPSLLEQKLRTVPGVRACAVRLMRPEEGNRLKAFIVPAADADEPVLRQHLHKFIKTEFMPEERPVSLTFGSKIPVNSMGKPCDWDIG